MGEGDWELAGPPATPVPRDRLIEDVVSNDAFLDASTEPTKLFRAAVPLAAGLDCREDAPPKLFLRKLDLLGEAERASGVLVDKNPRAPAEVDEIDERANDAVLAPGTPVRQSRILSRAGWPDALLPVLPRLLLLVRRE